MKYRITYLVSSEYCQIKPSDEECHRHIDIEADTNIEAVMQLHQDSGMIFNPLTKCVYPTVWSIE